MNDNKIKFVLFKNDRKESENHPDYKGYSKEEGWNAAAWIKTAKNGSKYLSVSYEPPASQEQAASYTEQMAENKYANPADNISSEFEADSDIPF